MVRYVAAAVAALTVECYNNAYCMEVQAKMTQPTDSDAAAPAPTSCIEPLRTLAHGDYTAWQGLGANCTRADVSAALGASQDDIDHYGNLGGTPTAYRIYPGTAVSPYGVYVWYVENKAVALAMHTITLLRPIEEQLGAPEAKGPSRMPGFKTQWIYASRGLTLHIDDDTGAVAWLYAYRPMTLDEFRASWLSRVEILRHRNRDND
jgi:hypothetical protein